MMTLQELESIIERLDTCNTWSVRLIHGRQLRTGFVYNVCIANIATENVLSDYVNSIKNEYIGERGKLSKYTDIRPYDGTTIGTAIYYLDTLDERIQEEYSQLLDAFTQPDQAGCTETFKANSYALEGNVLIRNTDTKIRLYTVVNPLRVLKNALFYAADHFVARNVTYLCLRSYVDVITIGDDIYMLSMDGEKLFNMERAYKSICKEKTDLVIEQGLVSDSEQFIKIATTGHNPRRFVAFNENRSNLLSSDIEFRSRISQQFLIPMDENDLGRFDTSDIENCNKLVKFLCDRGMLDPVDDSAVEVEGSKRWL